MKYLISELQRLIRLRPHALPAQAVMHFHPQVLSEDEVDLGQPAGKG